MGQSGYAETFTNIMLGWIRNLAGSIASMFQSAGGGASGGAAFLSWFGANWLGILVFLIVLGVVVDWIVWLIRWRPYWLWFHKRRIVLDDDIDEELSERELARRYDADRDEDEGPRFHSAVLRHDEADAGADDYGQDAYDPDEYDEGEYDGDFYDEDGEDGNGYYEDDDGGWDRSYDEPEPEDGDAARPDDYDDDWDDAPRKQSGRKRPLLFRARREVEEDPFAVDGDEFAGLDDDFYAVVSEEPLYAADAPDGGTGGEPESLKLDPIPEDAAGGDFDERIGYRSSFEPMTGTALSRKSRRRRE